MEKIFVAYYYFNNAYNLSLGISIDFKEPNIEIHLPFGFIRVGWHTTYPQMKRFGFITANQAQEEWRSLFKTE